MTIVSITPTTGTTGTLPTIPRFTSPGTVNTDTLALPIARQQAIENALSTALWHVRKEGTQADLQAATGRAVRAASLLKQACTDSQGRE